VIDRRATEDAIIESYRTVARAVDRITLPVLVERGITMAQFKALIAVSNAGEEGIAITALGCELSIGQPSASLIVDQLAKRGYAQRRPDDTDRRRVLVRATPAGQELVSELRTGRRSTVLGWLANVSDEDAETIERGLHAFAAAVRASADSAPDPELQ